MSRSQPRPIDEPWCRLSGLLPDAWETVFLRACTHEGASGRAAWQTWRDRAAAGAAGEEVVRALASSRSFAPLLHWNLSRNGVQLEPSVKTYFRSAALTEDIRWRKYREICGAVFRELNGQRIPFVVLKGAAFGEHYYPSPLLRHTGDIDLLLQEPDIDRAAAALESRGWTRSRAVSFMARHLRHAPPVVHPSGLPVEFHRRLMPSFYTIPYERLWARREPATIAGEDAAILSAADNLLHICLHAMGSERWLRWVVDGWFLIARAPRIDWDGFVATARASRACVPVYPTLRYLAVDMQASVPAVVLEESRDAAMTSGFWARRAARPIPSGSPAEIWSSPEPWWRRLARLARRAVPSPIDLALHFDIPAWQIPFDYVHRSVRYARYVLSRRRAAAPPAEPDVTRPSCALSERHQDR